MASSISEDGGQRAQAVAACRDSRKLTIHDRASTDGSVKPCTALYRRE